MAFDKIDPKVDFPALERDVLAFWERTKAFEKLREINRGKPKWSFLDGQIPARPAHYCCMGDEAVQELVLNRPRVGHCGIATHEGRSREDVNTPPRPRPLLIVILHGVKSLRGNRIFMIARHHPPLKRSRGVTP